jgi:hypothetical protein
MAHPARNACAKTILSKEERRGLKSLRENGIGDLSLTLLKGEQWVDFRRAVMAFQETW